MQDRAGYLRAAAIRGFKSRDFAQQRLQMVKCDDSPGGSSYAGSLVKTFGDFANPANSNGCNSNGGWPLDQAQKEAKIACHKQQGGLAGDFQSACRLVMS